MSDGFDKSNLYISSQHRWISYQTQMQAGSDIFTVGKKIIGLIDVELHL